MHKTCQRYALPTADTGYQISKVGDSKRDENPAKRILFTTYRTTQTHLLAFPIREQKNEAIFENVPNVIELSHCIAQLHRLECMVACMCLTAILGREYVNVYSL